MNDLEKKYFRLITNWPFKIYPYYDEISKEFIKKFISEISSDFLNVQESIELKTNEILEFLYCNIKIVNDILYDLELEISIPSINNKVRKTSYYFYLSLLISYNLDIVNFNYNIDIIRNINKQKCDNKKYKALINSKIILDLVNGFIGLDDYNNEYDKEINEIRKYNLNIIKNIDITELNLSLNENNIKNIKIDRIYMEIIKYLIINKKIENYEYTYEILEQLDLESINLTNVMLEELLKILDENKDYIKKYMISDINDLFNINKINFHYILFKYILKNPLYIYQIPFLLKTRKIIIGIIKKDLNKLFSFNINDNVNTKLEYIIKIITDSQYYYHKYINSKLNYYKCFLFESKKENINIIKKENENNNIKVHEKYIADFNKAQELNKRIPLIKYISDKINLNKKELKPEEIFNNYTKYWELLEKKIIEKDYEIICNNDKHVLINYFKDVNNKEILLNIFKEDIINNFILNIKINGEEEEDNDNQEYNINEENENENINEINTVKTEIEPNKPNNKNNENKLYIMKEEKEKKELLNKNSPIKIEENNNINRPIMHKCFNSSKKGNEKTFSIPTSSNNIIISNNYIKDSSHYIFFNYEGKLEDKTNTHSKTIEFIKEVSNGYYYSSGFYNNLNIYDDNLNLIIHKKNEVYSICENENAHEVILCDLKTINYGNLSKNNLISTNKEKADLTFILKPIVPEMEKFLESFKPILFCIKVNQNYHVLFGKKGAILTNYFIYNLIAPNNTILYRHQLNGGIAIDQEYVVLISNDIRNKGNKILISKILSRTINKTLEIKNSFNLSQNNLAYIEMKNKIKKKIILCACKKYTKNQKNGILLITFNDKYNLENKFYDTGTFEVYCFCQISIYIKKETKVLTENIKIKKTNYILVGGFEVNKSKGIIKLYKLIYNKRRKNVEIKYIEDIVFKDTNFKGFRCPVSCIIQSKKNGKILIGSFDGNIYIFTPPNIKFFNIINKICFK